MNYWKMKNQKANNLYIKLETKIEEILKYLPEEEENNNSTNSINTIDIKTEEDVFNDINKEEIF